jgi:hypothetical protein
MAKPLAEPPAPRKQKAPDPEGPEAFSLTFRKLRLGSDAGEEKREDEKGLYEGHAEEHGGEDLARSARVTSDAVEGGGNDFALAEGATKGGDADGETFSEGVHRAALSYGAYAVFSESHSRSHEREGGSQNHIEIFHERTLLII